MNRHAPPSDRNGPGRHSGLDRGARESETPERYGRGSQEDGGGRHGTEPSHRRRLSGSSAAELAKAHLLDLTGRPCEAVSSLSRTHDGWRVVLEMVELERIPRTTDILASYRVDLDEDGELMGYERIHRYCRNDVNGDS